MRMLAMVVPFMMACAAPVQKAEPSMSVAEIERLVKQGEVLFQKGHFRTALKKYQQARTRVVPAEVAYPEMLWNIARCHEELDEPHEALEALESFEQVARTPRTKAAVGEKLKELRRGKPRKGPGGR